MTFRGMRVLVDGRPQVLVLSVVTCFALLMADLGVGA
jgi:hypothetical protein